MLIPNSSEIPVRPLEYRLVLKFIDICTRKITEMIIHFFQDGKQKPNSSQQFASVRTVQLPDLEYSTWSRVAL
jgi:hypothetical protein